MSVPPDTVSPQRSLKPWLIAFAGLGILVRLVRYCLRCPFTGDEARLLANLVSRSYAGLTQPLEFNQVAPLPFLWLERAMMSRFGFSELSFRLPLIVAGILSVALFVFVARRLLDGAAAVLAVAVWAVAHFPIRYSAEIKPYGLDTLVSLGLLALAVQWWRERTRARWLWMLAAATPVALAISFPAVFVAGALSAALAWPVWRDGTVRVRLAFAVSVAALVGAGVIAMCWGAARPYKGWNDEVHRGVARWFWSQRPGLPVVCVDLDQRRPLYEGPPDPLYICYHAEYSAPRRRAARRAGLTSRQASS